jgi:hypothetical protein
MSHSVFTTKGKVTVAHSSSPFVNGDTLIGASYQRIALSVTDGTLSVSYALKYQSQMFHVSEGPLGDGA